MNISAINHFFSLQNLSLQLFHFTLLIFFSSSYALNSSSELRWAEQLRDNIVIGEPVDLSIASADKTQNTFFAIFTEPATASAKGAVVLMHGMGAHPDWIDIIHPLRAALPDKGWASLSIQLPLIANHENNNADQDKQQRQQAIKASVARVDSAIKFLRAKKYDYIVLLSHSFGSLMAVNYLQLKAEQKTPQGSPIVNAAIIIGTPSSGMSAPLNSSTMLKKIHIPMLDLYGSQDIDSVLRSAKARKTAANQAQNKFFRQVQIIGANHFFQGLDDELISYVSNWLDKTYHLPQ